MLEAAVQRFERSNARVNSTVVFAAPETFFPKFDDQNEALRKCCDKNFQSECGVGGDKGQVEVSGRAELCDSLKVGVRVRLCACAGVFTATNAGSGAVSF